MLKDEPTGKKTGLAEQKGLVGTQQEFRKQKEESLSLLEEGEDHSGGLQGCQEVMKG